MDDPKNSASFRERLRAFAEDERKKAMLLPAGPERDLALQKIRQVDAAAHLDEWANSRNRNRSFDPVAAAVDWLDAYRAADIDAIVQMHADAAVVDCRCCVRKTVTDKEHLRAFWKERMDDCVPSDLLDLQPILTSGTSVSFVTPRGQTTAVFVFNKDGKISHMEWGALTNR